MAHLWYFNKLLLCSYHSIVDRIRRHIARSARASNIGILRTVDIGITKVLIDRLAPERAWTHVDREIDGLITQHALAAGTGHRIDTSTHSYNLSYIPTL